jgi:hypothetical protein
MQRALDAMERTTKPHIAHSGPASRIAMGWRYTEAQTSPDKALCGLLSRAYETTYAVAMIGICRSSLPPLAASGKGPAVLLRAAGLKSNPAEVAWVPVGRFSLCNGVAERVRLPRSRRAGRNPSPFVIACVSTMISRAARSL